VFRGLFFALAHDSQANIKLGQICVGRPKHANGASAPNAERLWVVVNLGGQRKRQSQLEAVEAKRPLRIEEEK